MTRGAKVDPVSVHEAAQRGEREGLEALRDRLTAEMDGPVHARDLAALSRQVRDVLQRLAELEPDTKAEVTGLSDFQRKLAERRAAASDSRRTGA